MKEINFIILLIVLIFTSCKKENLELADNNIIPETFSVYIPQVLSNDNLKVVRNKQEIPSGDEFYEYLTTFIHVGDKAAQIVEEVIRTIRYYGLSDPMYLTYSSDDDGRTKNLEIIIDSEFEGTVWNYQMTITDAELEVNDDGGVAMQVFWNIGTIKGIAIMKPYYIDSINTKDIFTNAMFRIDYSEAGENGYEQEMTVSISGISLSDSDSYAMETMKMTVGRNDNIVEVFGNSNHPNAIFLQSKRGFNWAFTAAGETDSNLGVAELGLPPSNLNSDSHEVILGTYSLKNVFTDEIERALPDATPNDIAIYLQHTDAPGYFNAQGFVQGGVAPNTDYNTISAAIENLVPYNPYVVSNLKLEFKANTSAK